jgi:hypothetical protein
MYLPARRARNLSRWPETPGATASFPSGEAPGLGVAILETVEPNWLTL